MEQLISELLTIWQHLAAFAFTVWQLTKQLWSDLMPFIDWLGTLVASLFPWPFVTLVLAYTVLFSETAARRLRACARIFRRIRVGVAEVELSEEVKNQVLSAANEIKGVLNDYRRNIQDQVSMVVSYCDLRGHLAAFVEQELKSRFCHTNLPADFRCTIHVRDFLFRDRLYQLLEYYPSGGGPAGRTYPSGFGIIGQVWRSKLPRVRGWLVEPAYRSLSPDKMREHIASNWGMTLEQAYGAVKRPSFCCIPLNYKGRQLGVLYCDSTKEDAFGVADDDEHFLQRVVSALDASNLPSSVAYLMDRFENASAQISLEG